jgi:uncharacterized membrane protein
MFEPRGNVARTAYAAVFAALVAATTMALTVGIPSTKGYFNLGEVMVYTTAILTGPYVGALAGGVGSAISDVLLGYPVFAPGTLVVKGLEGFIVGHLYGKGDSKLVVKHWKGLTYVMGAVVFLLLAFVGLYYYAGDSMYSLDYYSVLTGGYPFSEYYYGWLALGLLAAGGIAYRGRRAQPKMGWMALSAVAGGAAMVIGYFLYEVGPLRIPVQYALVEVPLNVGQVVIGLVGALFLSESASAVLRKPASKIVPQRP